MYLEEQEIGEAHIFHRSLSPLVIRLILLIIITIAVCVGFDLASSQIIDDSNFDTFITIRSIFFFLLLLISSSFIVYMTIRWLTDIIVIDGKRIVARSGILLSKEDIYAFVAIPTIDVIQSSFGKILNYGAIKITRLSNEGDPIFFSDMPNPEHIVKVLEENINSQNEGEPILYSDTPKPEHIVRVPEENIHQQK